jgi:L-seryl-tRNA(Ser) seleniumtransferase
LKLSINEPNELSNRTPALQIRWDDKITGWTGADMERILFSGEPRMATAIAGNGINIVAYMLQDGDAEKIGPRLKEALAAVRPPARKDEAQPAANLDGRWRVRIEFLAGSATHYFDIHDKGGALTGTHQGDFVSRGLRGTISGASVDFASSYAERHGDSLQYRFTGKLQSDGSLSGDLNMGEYRMAKWAAVKV